MHDVKTKELLARYLLGERAEFIRFGGSRTPNGKAHVFRLGGHRGNYIPVWSACGSVNRQVGNLYHSVPFDRTICGNCARVIEAGKS